MSAWTGDYSVGGVAAALSARLATGENVVVVGHSLGGAAGLCMASGFFGPRILGVISLSMKVRWSDDDITRMAKVAARGVRWFDERDQAVEQYLRQAGLDGLVAADHPAVEGAVVSVDGRWRASQDPAMFAQEALDTAGLMAAARCDVVLGAGTADQMVSAADLAEFTPTPRMAEGAGHNVHVEEPGWVVALVQEQFG
jgi:pimeloyl-ACP methyl ester carboxylesterase